MRSLYDVPRGFQVKNLVWPVVEVTPIARKGNVTKL